MLPFRIFHTLYTYFDWIRFGCWKNICLRVIARHGLCEHFSVNVQERKKLREKKRLIHPSTLFHSISRVSNTERTEGTKRCIEAPLLQSSYTPFANYTALQLQHPASAYSIQLIVFHWSFVVHLMSHKFAVYARLCAIFFFVVFRVHLCWYARVSVWWGATVDAYTVLFIVNAYYWANSQRQRQTTWMNSEHLSATKHHNLEEELKKANIINLSVKVSWVKRIRCDEQRDTTTTTTKKLATFKLCCLDCVRFFFRGLEVRESIPLGKRPNNNKNS